MSEKRGLPIPEPMPTEIISTITALINAGQINAARVALEKSAILFQIPEQFEHIVYGESEDDPYKLF